MFDREKFKTKISSEQYSEHNIKGESKEVGEIQITIKIFHDT